MNLRDFAAAMTRSWLLITAATAAGLAGGWILAGSVQPVYSATSRVVVIAAEANTPEDAGRLTSMIRSEMSLYNAMARSTPVVERVAARVDGVTADEVSGATAPSVSDQVLLLTVSLPDQQKASQTARALAEELGAEIEAVHPGSPQLLRAESLSLPMSVSSDGASQSRTIAAGGVLGLGVGLLLAWCVAALRPLVGSGRGVSASGRLTLRSTPEPRAYHQLAAILAPSLRASESGAVVLVGTGSRVNLGPWVEGLDERLAAEASGVIAAPDGAGPVALQAVAGNSTTVLVMDPRDSLNEVQATLTLLEAAGANVVACLVVSDRA